MTSRVVVVRFLPSLLTLSSDLVLLSEAEGIVMMMMMTLRPVTEKAFFYILFECDLDAGPPPCDAPCRELIVVLDPS